MTRLTERPYSRILALVLALLLALNTIPSGGFRTFAGEEGEGQEQGGGETPTGAVTDQTSATVKLFYQNDVPENVQLKAKGTVTFTNTVNEEDVKSVEIDDNGVITVEGFSDGASYQLSFGNTYLYDSANSLYISGVSDPIELNNNADIMVLCNVVGTKEYTGKVKEGTGESVLPVSGATVTVSAIGGRALPEAKAATTEADGSFSIALPILEGQAVSATVSKQYYETATPDPAWTIPAGTETNLGTITLSPVPDNTPPVISFATTARDGCFWAYDLWNQLWGKGDSSQIYFTVSDGTPQNENEPKSGPSKVYYCVGTVSTVDDLLAKDDKVTVDIEATNGVCTFAATDGTSYSFFAEDKAGKRTGLYTVTCKADASDPYISTVALFSDEQCSSNQGIEEKANGYASNETMYLKLIAQDTGAGLRAVSLYTKLTGGSDAYALYGTFAPTSQNELIIPLTATEFSVLTDLAIVVEDLVGNKQGSDTNPVSISNLNAGLSKDAVIISGGRAKISVTVSPTPRVIPAVTGTPEEPAQQSVPERVVFGTFPAYTFELTDTSVDEQSRKIKDITVIVNGTPVSVKLKGTEDTIDNTQEYPSPVEFDVVNPTIPDPTDNTKTISLFVEGENKIEVSCKNHLGLQTTEEYTFYLQTTQPAITGVQIAPVNGTSMRIDGDTVYANGPLTLTVSMDNIAYLCGETVSLYNDGEEAAIASGAVGENNSVTLTIPYASGENVTLNLSVKAVDAFGRESACTFTTDGNFSNMSSGKILLSDAEPSVSINVGTPDYTDGNGKKWYKTEPTTTVTVTSEFIKIHSVVISVNGTPVEEFTASEQNPTTGNYSKQLSLSGNNVYNEHVIKVTATDNTGVEITVTDAIYIDRAAPATPTLSIAAANGAPVNLVDGVYYANGEVSFTASATDAQTAVNVIKLFEKDDASGNETEITGAKNQDGTYTFNIALSSSKTRKFLARAYDMVGRSSDSSTFTVTMEKTAPVISATLTGDPEFRTVGNGENERKWYSSDVTWNVQVEDGDSGIGSYKIKLNGTELNADSAGNTLPSVGGSFVQSISVLISTAQVAANTDCSYTLEVVATDNAGNQSAVWTETVYIDSEAPVVTGFEVTKANEAGTLNSLDFGTFGNGPIIVKVTAQDPAEDNPASGIASVILYVNGEKFGETAIAAGQNTATCTYTLPKDLAASFAEDVKISAVVVDRSGKSGAPTELTADNSNLESGEILLENTAPAVSAKIIGNPEFRTVGNGENERKWYSSDVTWQVEIKDAESGIGSYQIKLNGAVLDKDSANKALPPVSGSKVPSISVSISTAQVTANTDCSYTLEVVTTDNAGNQSTVWTETVYIDGTLPIVTAFEVIKANEAGTLNSLDFGTFGNGPIIVKVTAQDPAGNTPASGVKTVILYVNDTEFDRTEIPAGQNTVTCTYTLPKDLAASFAEDVKISAVVVDRSGGKSGAPTELTAENSNLKSGLILIENNVPTVSVTVDESVVTPVVRDGKTWYSSDVMWNISIEDADSGIGSYQIKLNGTLLSSVSEDEKETIVSVPVSSLQAAANADCSFTIEVVATDNAGNVSETVTQTVHIDAVRPVVTGFEVTKANEADSLTSLDFGTFGNGPLTVNVTVQDPAGDAPASGIESVILYVNGELFEATAIAAGQNTVTCTYTVPKELAANFATGVKISAQATDRSGNWGTVTELTPSNSNLKSGQILLENNRPTASIAVTVPGGNSVVRDGMEWYSADTLWDISVSDADAGIANVTVTVNGNPVMTDRNGVNISDLFAGSEPVKEAVVSISSVNFETSYDASYTLSVMVTDLAGNVSETVTRQIYRDSQAPSITGFRYFVNGEERMQEATPDQSGYGVFSMNGITVVISAFEPLPGAGLKSITYVLEDTETGRTEERAADVNESGEIAVTINAPFKGRIYAMATDYATNGGTYSMSAGLIIEAGETHNNEQHIAIEKAATEFRQANGTELYNGNVELTVRVSDAVSGIRSIEWSVVAPFDQGKNQNGVLTVGADGSLAGDAGWVAEATDANLATELRKTFVISHDSNDIVFRVKITDRAGHQTERTVTFGIDKTAPSVEYFFDNKTGDPDHPTVFNDIRTMTIVVTERNFTGTDFICDIKNPGGGVPTISLWTEERDSVDPNKSTYTATVAFNFDGNFTVNLGYMDRAGNRAAIAAPTTEFAIDRAKPVVSIVYDGRSAYSENYYKEPRTAIVKVIERNFDVARVSFSGNATKTGSWVANGDEHTLTVEFNDDGEYRFGVSVTDRAGNVSLPYTDDTFIIDTAAPTLTLEGIADANRGEVAPVITVTDRNFRAAGIKITITKSDGTVVTRTYSTEEFVDGDDFGIRVRFKNFDPMKENDDIYTMSVSAIDLAGNRSEEIVRTFSVNRFGSTYDMTGVEDRSGIFTSMPKDIVFTEINVDDIERDSVEIYVIRNSVPKKLTKDTDFFVEEITEPGADWKAYRYTIKSNTFSEDGEYSIRVVSKDKAGNINENDENGKNGDITFCVDRVAPNVIVISPEDEKSYVQNSLAASIEVRDNYKLDTVMIFLNDKEVSYTRNGNMFTFTVPQDDTKQTLRVVAVDAAGNTSVVEVKDFLVSTNMFIRFINNPAAVIAAIIALLALIGGTIFFVIIKRRRYA